MDGPLWRGELPVVAFAAAGVRFGHVQHLPKGHELDLAYDGTGTAWLTLAQRERLQVFSSAAINRPCPSCGGAERAQGRRS
jgi:hypothetical protein